MSTENQTTLHTYDQAVEQYRDSTAQQTSGFQAGWIDFLLKDLPLDADILELGSAFGRDATYIVDKGYAPKLTDGSAGFVEYLRAHGYDAEVLDIVNEKPQGSYDLILACAVFLHFTEDDFKQAITNVKSALKAEGKFALSLKQGDGAEWTEAKMNMPRYFNYWRKETLERTLGEVGMSLVDCQTTPDGKWLHAIARKEGEQ